MPPAKKSRKLSRKELQQLKEYGELDPLNSTSDGNDLDELISKAMSKGGSRRTSTASFSRHEWKSGDRKKGSSRASANPEKPMRPDAYTKLLQSLSDNPTKTKPLKRTAAIDSEDEDSGNDSVDADLSGGDNDLDNEPGLEEFEDEGRDADQDEDPEDDIEAEDEYSDHADLEEEEEEEDDTEKSDKDENAETCNVNDFMTAHLSDNSDNPLCHKKLAAVTQREYKQIKIDDSVLSHTILYDTGSGIQKPNPKPLKQRLIKPLHKLNGNNLTDLQQGLFNWFDQYRDVVYAGRTIDNEDSIMTAYAVHALNHVYKTRDHIIKNNAKLSKAHAAGREPGELRDQGFTRPKVLVVLPFRSNAYRFVHKILKLSAAEQESNKARFEKEFSSLEDEDVANKHKPLDYQHVFSGNIDDSFRFGIQLGRKNVKLYSGFYNSDIIITSPVGLRLTTGAESAGKGDFDFLSSIEIVVVDQCDTLLMQNWDHVKHMFEHLNKVPKKDHGCDFSRVRNWYLDGTSKYRRQTIVLSDYLTPEIQAVFSNHCTSIEGKVRIKPSYSGAVTSVVAQVPQVFKRLNVQRLATTDDELFTYFTEHTLPDLEQSAINDKHTLIFIPSYFDFVRVRNFCKDRGYSFAAISEYSTRSEAMNARRHFFEGKIHFFLYSERAHFFHRYPIKGIHHMVFYRLPEHPNYYSELVNLMLTSNDETASAEILSCMAMFTKYDQLRLERIVGSRLVGQILTGEKSQYTFA